MGPATRKAVTHGRGEYGCGYPYRAGRATPKVGQGPYKGSPLPAGVLRALNAVRGQCPGQGGAYGRPGAYVAHSVRVRDSPAVAHMPAAAAAGSVSHSRTVESALPAAGRPPLGRNTTATRGSGGPIRRPP